MFSKDKRISLAIPKLLEGTVDGNPALYTQWWREHNGEREPLGYTNKMY